MVSLTGDQVLFAKNSDRDPNECQVIEWHPAAEHDPGSTVRCTWIAIDQVQHTNAIMISRPWWMWGAEIGANEHGVVIGNEAVFTKGLGRRARGEPEGLLGMDMLRLALERSRTAEQAVATIVGLLERHGQYGPCSHDHPGLRYDNSFLVADGSGAVVLETAGRAHATEEVAGPARSISNGLTIAGFAATHADPLRGRVARCAERRALTEARSSRAREVTDLFEALRDHGGGAAPRYSLLSGALGAPCAHPGGALTSTQTTSSWAVAIDAEPVHWVTATAAPCTSVFKPVRVGQPVDLGPTGTNTFDARSMWWRHELLHRGAIVNPPELIGRYAAERQATEAAWSRHPPDSAEAFAAFAEMEKRWLTEVDSVLSIGTVPDTRPAHVRALWSRWNRRAGITAELSIPPTGRRPSLSGT